MKRLALLLALLPLCSAQDAKRPRILGISHVALHVSDLGRARAFYKGFLGFDESFTAKRENGSEQIAYIKINDEQYIELFAEPAGRDGQLHHICFYTDDAEGARTYLASRVVTAPKAVSHGPRGNRYFFLTDPDGHAVEIIQYVPDGFMAREKGRFTPASRAAARIGHLGVLTRDMDRALGFYRDVLGFQATAGDKWRVPDGEDSLELGLNRKQPTPDRLNIKNHICFDSPDVAKVVATLRARAAREIEVHETSTGKRVANLYDPDGSRIEFMER